VLLAAIIALTAGLEPGPDAPEPRAYQVDAERSVVAFITFKGGFLAGLAENVVSTPTEYQVDLRLGQEASESRFSIEIDTGSIEVNDADTLDRWYPAIHDRKILDKPPGDMGGFRRRRIRKAMFSEKMLHVVAYPTISAKTTAIVPLESDSAGETHRIHLDLTIRDHTVSVDWPAVVRRDGDSIAVETHGPLKFTEFGIDPYSSFLGAVKYEDEFQVFAHIEARAAPDAGSAQP
jgi:polyisoprenoid-binding protein YceI